MLEKYIEILKPHVLELFKDDTSGHDITHLERTMRNALFIQTREGGDEIILGIAAFLHDVHRIMQTESGVYVSPYDSLPKVKEILSYIDLSAEQVDKILNCIEHHEEYNWNNPKNKEEDINVLILQDADNLDAIGAIGIARTFLYGGAHGIVMHDSSLPLDTKDDYLESKGDNETAIQHFVHKLFKLGDNMNTATARKIAKKEVTFMKNFTKQFLMEWEGNYDL